MAISNQPTQPTQETWQHRQLRRTVVPIPVAICGAVAEGAEAGSQPGQERTQHQLPHRWRKG